MKNKLILIIILLLAPVVCLAALSPIRTIQNSNLSVIQPNLNINVNTNTNNNTNSNTNNGITAPTTVVAPPPPTYDVVAPILNANLNTNINTNTNINSGIRTNVNVNTNQNAGAILDVTAPSANVVAPNPSVVNTIVIIDPKGGEQYVMDGKTITVYFKYFGIDSAKTGKLKFKVNLLQDGKTLGPVSGMYPYDLDITKDYASLGYTPGRYTDLIKKESVLVEPNDNFSLEVIILEGENVFMSAVSNEFSFVNSDAVLPPLSLKVMSPNGGEEFIKDASVISGYYTYVGLDPNTLGGTYKTRLELWRNGTLIGNLYNMDFTVNPNQDNSSFGFMSGTYWDEAAKSEKLAESGGGYKIKVTFFKDNQEIISDSSDNSFSFKDGPSYTGTPAAKIITPNGGEKFIKGKDNRMEVSFTGFDPYDNGKLHYELYLYKGGNKLGKIGLSWLTDMVNLKKESEYDYDEFKQYYDKETDKYIDISVGSDYKIGIEVYRYQDLILQNLSDNNFSIVKEGTVAGVISNILGKEAKIIAPAEIKSALYEIADSDSNIKSIKVTDNKVEMKYQQKAKLFGFIPVKYKLKINTDLEKKQVTSKKPWWLFLASDEADELTKASQDMIDKFAENQQFKPIGKFNQSEISLKLSDKMEEHQKIITTLSTIISKISTSADVIIQNIK